MLGSGRSPPPTHKKGRKSRGDEDDSSEPETVVYSDDSSTADTDDFLSDAEPGVATDASADLGHLYWLRSSLPNIHRGPQANSLHVTFNRLVKGNDETYKLQLSYEQLYRVKQFVEALADVAHLFAADPARRYLTIAKTFNNPRKGMANVFIYFVRSAPVDALMAIVSKLRTHFKVRVGWILCKESSDDAQTLSWL